MSNVDNRYYTPSIEDIRIGYEYEQCFGNPQDDISISEHNWNKCKFPDPFIGDRLNIFKKVIETGIIRTPYLTKERMEMEGWIDQRDRGMEENYGFEMKKGNFTVRYWETIHRLQLFTSYIRYDGTCPSINEFRTIYKLLE